VTHATLQKEEAEREAKRLVDAERARARELKEKEEHGRKEVGVGGGGDWVCCVGKEERVTLHTSKFTGHTSHVTRHAQVADGKAAAKGKKKEA